MTTTNTLLSKSQQRWRNAFAVIYSLRVMLSLARETLSKRNNLEECHLLHSSCHSVIDLAALGGSSFSQTLFTTAQKRWRNAYAAIYSIRVVLSLAREITSRNGSNKQTESAIYLADSEGPSFTFTIFPTAQKRWRNAYAAIYSFRVVLSLAQEITSRNSSNKQEEIEIIFQSDLSAESSTSYHSNEELLVKPLKPVSLDFNIDQTRLINMAKEKNADGLHALGGIKGLAAALGTDHENGINSNDLELSKRRERYGSNTYRKKPPQGVLFFVFEAFKDTTIIILLVCAALALGFGIKEHGAEEGWYEGGSIFIAIFLVIVVSALSNFRQERQFHNLSKISDNVKVDVLRDGRRLQISIFDLVVGDIVHLKIGDQIPADGLFLDGHSLQVDESSMTGESDHVEVDSEKNPFMFSGSKVADGFGRMLVTSVGMNTSWGEMMSSITRDSSERTPLQARLDKLTSSIGKVGLSVAFLVLLVLLIRYFTGNTKDEYGNREYNGSKTKLDDVFNSVIHIVAAAVTIVVVAIPEGLPLAVTLTLAYSMKRMMADQAMVRKLAACETMGSATVICTDKTGTLTQNQMKVTKLWLGLSFTADDSFAKISPAVLELFYQAAGFNTTGSVCRLASSSTPEFSGSPTEKAILSWAVQDMGMEVEKLKQNYKILHVETFNSEKKRSGVLIRKNSDGTLHVHWKGAAEMILAMCSSYMENGGRKESLDGEGRSEIEKAIQAMAASSLRCIAFAYTQTRGEIEHTDDRKTLPRLKEDNLTLLGIVGIKDPCRPEVKSAVDACKAAGVKIKMITGDNVFTAKAIATECGILGPTDQDSDAVVVEGVEFRNYTSEERIQKVDKIKVMARSSPFDKLLMVQCLRESGEVVAVTGDGTNDAPALREADIGLSMGIQGTEVAKESSDIIILDDNFTSVATVLRWGRCVYNNIQKFIQFQLTVNVAALVINFIAAVSTGDVPLTTVQLLWVNLIMDTLGALALATERPTKELMNHKPVGRTEPLITNIMWRNLLAQAVYQISVLLILQFKGQAIFDVNKEVKNTLIFNTFVFCQVFNEFNSRNLEKQNVFKGIHKNHLFLGIVGFTIFLQAMMVEFLKKFADTVSLNWWQWGVCILIAVITFPIGFIVKFVPVPKRPFFNYFKGLRFIFLIIKQELCRKYPSNQRV